MVIKTTHYVTDQLDILYVILKNRMCQNKHIELYTSLIKVDYYQWIMVGISKLALNSSSFNFVIFDTNFYDFPFIVSV